MSLLVTAIAAAHRRTRRCLEMLRTLLLSPGQQRLTKDWDIRLNQIPEDWHQDAVKFRMANGIRDGDIQFTF